MDVYYCTCKYHNIKNQLMGRNKTTKHSTCKCSNAHHLKTWGAPAISLTSLLPLIPGLCEQLPHPLFSNSLIACNCVHSKACDVMHGMYHSLQFLSERTTCNNKNYTLYMHCIFETPNGEYVQEANEITYLKEDISSHFIVIFIKINSTVISGVWP